MDPNETLKSDEGVEDRYVYYAAVPSLQQITCIRILRRIWSSYISRRKNCNDLQKECGNELMDLYGFPDIFTYLEDLQEMQDLLRLPRTFKGMLTRASMKVSSGIRLWIYHLECYTMGKKNERYSIRDLVRDFDIDWCVWLPNGRIDDEQTAMKLLSTVNLSNEQRFAIFSEFCMKREIDQIKLRSLRKSFKKSVTFEDNPLVYYWIRYLRRDLSDIPISSYRTVYAAVAEKCARISWIAFEYFWHRCDVEDQILVAQYILNDYDNFGYRYQERILSMMSWFQQHRLFTLMPEKIISNFFVHLNLPESTSWALKHSELKPSSFASLVKDSFSCVTDEEQMSRLIEIWDAVSPTHKRITVHNLQYQIFPRFCGYCDSLFRPSQSGVKFLIKLLSHLDAQFREREVLSNAVSLGVYIDNLNLLNELLELSLPSADDQALFKTLVEQSSDLNERCVSLMTTNAELTEVNAKLQFYLPDSNAIQKYKQRMISELVKEECFLYDTNKWNAFSAFIDETFPDDASAALKLKKEYILRHARCFPCTRVYYAYEVNPMIQVVESVFNTENENENIKDVFFNSFVSMLKQITDYRWYKMFFNEMYFRRFVRWCLGEEDPAAVLKYNCGAFIQDVVAGVLGALNNCYVEMGEFKEALLHDLDRCLMWYLSDEERVKEYKLEWIKVVQDLDIVQSVAQRNDTVSLETLCIWFFDEDQDAIQQFKSKRVKLQSS
ncbi:uncharacterized protein LOC135845321 [Planococcus citri]|uniref:uncharacterized protein LOC135845321 n=1 Tax=Planococcus citri TaxID=170843 RepID=UPI0031F91CB3